MLWVGLVRGAWPWRPAGPECAPLQGKPLPGNINDLSGTPGGAVWDNVDKTAAFQILRCSGETIVDLPANAIVLAGARPRGPGKGHRGRTGGCSPCRMADVTRARNSVSAIRYMQDKHMTIMKLFLLVLIV